MKEIRKDCFWYRPWKDMSATFNQCELEKPTECPCTKNCEWYISKAKADETIWSMLQNKQIEANHKLFENINKDNAVWWTPNKK